jgi:uncharacterized protein
LCRHSVHIYICQNSAITVAFAYIFVSQVTGQTHGRSDVDVAVYLDPLPPDTLEARLAVGRALEGDCGVGPVDVVVLQEASLRLVGRILQERVVVYSRDEPRRVAWESLMARQWADFAPRAKRMDEARLRAIAEGRA